MTNAASVALALGGDDAQAVRAVTEGWLLGSYTFAEYKQDTKAESTEASEVVVLSSAARKAEAIAAFEDAQVVAAAVAATRDWVNRPAGDLTSPQFAESVSSATSMVKSLPKGKSAAKVGSLCTTSAAGRARLRRHPGRRLGSSAPPDWSS